MTITTRIHALNTLITQLESTYQRAPGTVELLAVSKGQSVDAIKQAFAAGLRHFGESYLQEAQTKMRELASLPICWHFIGPIQSNKTLIIARDFSWVHSLCRLKIAQLLHEARPSFLPPLNVCLQVNLDDEQQKAGIHPDEMTTLITAILKLPHLRLRGLMMIPKPRQNEQQQYLSFLRLSDLLHTLNQKLDLSLDTLSMGMSQDFPAAIRAGSTFLRIGQAIFGERL